MHQLFDVREFFVSGTNPNVSHVLLSIVEPNTPEEIRRGYMCTVAELTHCSIQEIKRIQEEVDSMQETFYREPLGNKEVPLELVLEKVNSRTHLLRPAHGTLSWTVAAIHNERIDIAFSGSALCFMLFQKKNSMERVSLTEDTPNDPAQIFNNMLTGNIRQGDILLCATPQTAKHLSEERLEKILTARPPRNAAAHIQHTLEPLGKGDGFAGVLIRSIPDKELPKTGPIPPYLKGNSATSLSKLAENEESTRTTLFPPLIGKLRDAITKKTEEYEEDAEINAPTKTLKTHSKNIAGREAPEGTVNAIGLVVGKVLVRSVQAIIFVGKILFAAISRILFILMVFITNRGGGRAAMFANAKSYIQYISRTIRSLALWQKITITTCAALLLAGMGTALYAQKQHQKKEAVKSYEQAIRTVRERIAYAEAQKIIQNDEAALFALHEAQEALNSIPVDAASISEERKNAGEDLNALMRDVRKITLIQGTPITHINSSTPIFIAGISQSFVTWNAEKHIGIFNTISNAFTQYSQHMLSPITTILSPKEQDYILAVTANGEIGTIDVGTGAITKKSIDFPLDPEKRNIVDAGTYNRKLYTLSGASRMIYKHSPTQIGFDKGAPWVTDGAHLLTNPISFAIDGDVYVANSEGTVVKFASGKAVPFSISAVDPAITSLSRIRTNSDTNYIYLLDQKLKRIIIITKTGQLVSQITDEAWQSPSDFFVNEKTKTIYIIDNGSLLAGTLSL